MPKHSTPHGLAAEATPEQDTYERGNISREGQDTAFGDLGGDPKTAPEPPTQPLVNINQGPQLPVDLPDFLDPPSPLTPPVEKQPGQMSDPVTPHPSIQTLLRAINERLDSIDASLDLIPDSQSLYARYRNKLDEAFEQLDDRLVALEAPGFWRRTGRKIKGWFE